MTIEGLINKPDTHPYTLEECYFLISRYIFERKGMEITPNIMLGFPPREIQLLHKALNIIIAYYKN